MLVLKYGTIVLLGFSEAKVVHYTAQTTQCKQGQYSVKQRGKVHKVCSEFLIPLKVGLQK